MIDKDMGFFTVICDICGDELESEFSFGEAVEAKKKAGWISKCTEGEWEDVCCACKELR